MQSREEKHVKRRKTIATFITAGIAVATFLMLLFNWQIFLKDVLLTLEQHTMKDFVLEGMFILGYVCVVVKIVSKLSE